ncbi:MAG: ribonuclease P protein component [Clostridia bacterium]|nr:ribonuclease P protein component [Clostridia bacterium]MDD4386333.1 ribonuclease P protein component [Clostridia bacterium]
MKYTSSIKKKGTFRYLIKKGKFSREKYLVVYFIKNSKSTNVLGICVSKKNGISVHRNKMKRWIREIYKTEECKLKKGLTLVVMYRKETKIEDVDYYKLKDNIVKAFEKLNIYEV